MTFLAIAAYLCMATSIYTFLSETEPPQSVLERLMMVAVSSCWPFVLTYAILDIHRQVTKRKER